MANVPNRACPICKLGAKDVRVWDYGERISLECSRCGKFAISGTAARMAESRNLGPKLSAWIRERSESGSEVPEINSDTLKDVEDALPNYRVSEKQLLLLRAFERRTAFPGQPINVVPNLDYPLAWASGEKEFVYLLHSLIERGLVRRTDGPADLNDSFVFQLEVTSVGWDFLEDHARPAVISDQVFVAMSFAPELTPAWRDGIQLALLKAKFRPYRVDAVPHIDRIDTKIITVRLKGPGSIKGPTFYSTALAR